MSTTPSQRGTQHRKIRMDAQLWDELGAGAQLLQTDRSDIIRDGARSELRRRLRQLDRDRQAREQLRAITRG